MTPGLCLSVLVLAAGSSAPAAAAPDIALFFQAAQPDAAVSGAALRQIEAAWRDDYAAILVDLARLMRPPRPARGAGTGGGLGPAGDFPGSDEIGPGGGAGSAPGAGAGAFPETASPRAPQHPSTPIRERLVRFLERQTGKDFGHDLGRWREWYWQREYAPHPDYGVFKAALYGQIDPRMTEFFADSETARVRLDEIDWGGVGVNGIPPLDHPRVVPAREAGYLDDKHVVFGIEIDGEARAYPKRILAWHELALDRLGGVELAIVYCTLCGTVIPYQAQLGERRLTLGTSGLLYRSNKLMFDAETRSLWNTVEGRPVVGPLAGSELELVARPVVTTTWRDWRAAHPDTSVLSLDTGHERDYSEGAAYRDYFRSDRLMFSVPRLDDRLDNKDEVLALLLRPPGAPEAPREALAIAASFLRKKQNRLFHYDFAGHRLVVVTSDDGANRVYDAGARRFAERLERGQRLRDAEGGLWRVHESALVAEVPGPAPLARLPARRAFWFGWFAQYPETELVE